MKREHNLHVDITVTFRKSCMVHQTLAHAFPNIQKREVDQKHNYCLNIP